MIIDTSNAILYHDGAFPPQELDYGQIMSSMLGATDALARYDQMLRNMHNSEIFLAPLRNQEAVISSRMEGTISTMDEILQLEAEYGEEITSASDARSEVIETILYQRALRSAQREMEQGRPLSASLLKSIHQQLLSFGRGAQKSPGAFKTEQNYIGDRGSKRIRFVPIAPEKLESGMDALFNMMRDEKQPILLRTALAHIELEALHPFKDGNGRVGRMLITLMLWAGKAITAPHFYISRYFEENKDEYIATMRDVSEKGAWGDWCAFFFTAVREQAIHNLDVANRIQTLYEEMKGRFSQILASKWSISALDYIFTYPVFANNRFRKGAGIPSQTAGRFTRLLTEEDLLQKVQESSGRRAAIYRFEPLMELLRV
ncbi:MAG: Fic family protein [Verrucomicrobiota bacterium]